MPFVEQPGLEGLVWEPEPRGPRKHACPDCFVCQMCGDERCRVCLAGRSRKCERGKRKAESAAAR